MRFVLLLVVVVFNGRAAFSIELLRITCIYSVVASLSAHTGTHLLPSLSQRQWSKTKVTKTTVFGQKLQKAGLSLSFLF
jgi:hypothetical protein